MNTTCPSTSTNMAIELTNQILEQYQKNQVKKCRSTAFLKEVDVLMKSEKMAADLKYHRVNYVKAMPFGSSATKLKTVDSDLDTVIIVNAKREMEHKDKTDLLFAMRRHISNHFGFQEATVAHKAKVPVIKCASSEFEADFVLHFESTVPTNFLAALSINAYCQIEPKLIQLSFVLKKWAKHFMAQNYSEKEMISGLPNSYTLVLLAISMLQQNNILPNLTEVRPDLFDVDHATWDTVGKVSMLFPLKKQELANIKKELDGSELSVGDMLLIFFEIYGNMDLGTLIFDTKSARIIEKETASATDPLIVIDQYDSHIPSRRVTRPFIFEALCRKALDTIEASDSGDVYDNLMSMWFGVEHPNGSFLRPKTWRELGYSSLAAYNMEEDHNLGERRQKQKEQFTNPKIKPIVIEVSKWNDEPWIPDTPPFDDEC